MRISIAVLLVVFAVSFTCGSIHVPDEHEIMSSPRLSALEQRKAIEFWTEEEKASVRGHPAMLSGGDVDRIHGPPHPNVMRMLKEAGLLDDSHENHKRKYVDTTGLPDGTSLIYYDDYWKYPFKAEGRVFGRDPVHGYKFGCSGALVGDNVVMTAGHCCGSNGKWNTDMVLDLQYKNGCGPNCTALPFSRMKSPSGWMLQSYWKYDYCFAHIDGPSPGYSLPLAVSVTQARIYLACGYPTNTASDPGEYLWCTRNAQSTSESGSKGIPSKLGEGASGGPWTIGSNITAINWHTPDTNTVNGLNSHIYPGKLVMYSPNFDSLTMQTYLAAVNDG